MKEKPRISRVRMAIVVGLMLVDLLAATWLVLETWDVFCGLRPAAWQSVPFILDAAFIVSSIVSRRFYNAPLRFTYTLAAAWLGFLSFAFFATCACWIALAAATLLKLNISLHCIAAVFFGVAVVISLYGLVNASTLSVTRVTVKLSNLPDAWNGREVALVSDLHLGNIRGAGFVRRVVAELQILKPEAVFISGDLFDGTKVDAPAQLVPWKSFSAPAGTYFATGNHEEFHDCEQYLAAIEGAGIRVLRNEKVEAQGLQIAGVADGDSQKLPLYAAVLQRMNLDRARPVILIVHRPANLAVPEAAGISLQLSGHTHGGQFWPWTWAARRVHRRFVYGLNKFGKMQVFTSCGAGTWGAPMRVGTKAEIVLIRLESAGA